MPSMSCHSMSQIPLASSSPHKRKPSRLVSSVSNCNRLESARQRAQPIPIHRYPVQGGINFESFPGLYFSSVWRRRQRRQQYPQTSTHSAAVYTNSWDAIFRTLVEALSVARRRQCKSGTYHYYHFNTANNGVVSWQAAGLFSCWVNKGEGQTCVFMVNLKFVLHAS